MKFWESMKVALGMQSKGIAPSFLKVDKLTLDGGPIKIEWKGVAEITNDEVLIAKMVHDLFIDKYVMHAPMDKEVVDYVLSSLEDLRAKVEAYVNRFIGSTSAKDRFFAAVLLAWSSAAKVAIRGIQDAKAAEAKDREAYRRSEIVESSDIMCAEDALPDILAAFRRESFPPVALLVDLLPSDHLARRRAEPLLAASKAFLLQKYVVAGQEILEPSWEIEF